MVVWVPRNTIRNILIQKDFPELELRVTVKSTVSLTNLEHLAGGALSHRRIGTDLHFQIEVAQIAEPLASLQLNGAWGVIYRCSTQVAVDPNQVAAVTMPVSPLPRLILQVPAGVSARAAFVHRLRTSLEK